MITPDWLRNKIAECDDESCEAGNPDYQMVELMERHESVDTGGRGMTMRMSKEAHEDRAFLITENKRLRGELDQRFRTSQWHKDNHLAAEAKLTVIGEYAKNLPESWNASKWGPYSVADTIRQRLQSILESDDYNGT